MKVSEGHHRPGLSPNVSLTSLLLAFSTFNGAKVQELPDIESTADTLGVALVVELVGLRVGLSVGVGVGGRAVGTTALGGKTTALP